MWIVDPRTTCSRVKTREITLYFFPGQIQPVAELAARPPGNGTAG